MLQCKRFRSHSLCKFSEGIVDTSKLKFTRTRYSIRTNTCPTTRWANIYLIMSKASLREDYEPSNCIRDTFLNGSPDLATSNLKTVESSLCFTDSGIKSRQNTHKLYPTSEVILLVFHRFWSTIKAEHPT